jgi:pyruvate/2-oxoglutarate dehydrogenase complex dihydrolipoamide acyltransferase (E2) component
VIEFKLPALGENIEQGDLVRLMIAPGAAVSEGQAVMELETDKAVVEVPSSVSGTVKEILVKQGEKIKVGQVVFTADGNGTSAAAAAEPTRKCRVRCKRKLLKSNRSKQLRSDGRDRRRCHRRPLPSQGAPQRVTQTQIDGRRSGSPRISSTGTRRKYLAGRPGALDDCIPAPKFPKASRSWNSKPRKPSSKFRRPSAEL